MKHGPTKKCPICAKEVYFSPSRISAKFCSWECKSKSQRTGKPTKCTVCGKEYYRSPSLIRIRGSSYCSKKCMYSIKRSRNTRATRTRVWAVFSKYIRTRDKGICFTCGKYATGMGYHAGHYIPSSICGVLLKYHEANVHGQCFNCNINLGGYGAMYDRKMREKYGEEFVEELWRVKNQEIKQFTKLNYEKIYDEFKGKLELLNKVKN